MFDIADHESDKDTSKIRTMDLGTNKIHIECKDPYGFWYISFERGNLPEKLKGCYTEYDKAEQAVQTYIRDKGKTVFNKE